MNEIWFDPGVYAWIPGTLLGVIGGGIGGPLAGVFASRGKHKKLVLGFFLGLLVICVGLLSVGAYAFFSGQPYGVWYAMGFPGFLGMIIFGCMIFVILYRYREAELRRSVAIDM